MTQLKCRQKHHSVFFLRTQWTHFPSFTMYVLGADAEPSQTWLIDLAWSHQMLIGMAFTCCRLSSQRVDTYL
ncbi:uncharacterized protein SPSK_01336 [Sporothrix schenckii 1099-18]|uniref:Uncharacterized protein n=1 Tax=Sporothrix schenckii 1099-18 TaxID=1397361 RepID=A0A0F2LVJ6_SPOSC|nr:uncharacterized protein SPSK_01336 [Sporothrix schenckii 1099-18]KJR81468.1 hypothetical protein SPSK_01336 [Sporothrix schenckii 1099-18]